MQSWQLLIPLLAGAVTWVALAWMLHSGAAAFGMDQPNERSLHVRPTPRTGGIGLMLGVFCAWLALPLIGVPIVVTPATLAFLLFGVSLLDDMRNLSIRVRFAIQVAVATVLVGTLAGQELPWWLAAPLVIAVVWMTNLYNFMDGADGIAGGMAVFGFGAYALAAADGALALMSLSIVAASLAFLRFNFHPARIFMGDCGSVPLGFLAAALGLLGWREGVWPAWFPPLVFMPFVFDATLTLLRRMARGDKFWQAHREHNYQKLVRMGYGHRNTALMEYAAMLTTALLGLWALRIDPAAQWLLFVIALVAYALCALVVERKWRAWERQSI